MVTCLDMAAAVAPPTATTPMRGGHADQEQLAAQARAGASPTRLRLDVNVVYLYGHRSSDVCAQLPGRAIGQPQRCGPQTLNTSNRRILIAPLPPVELRWSSAVPPCPATSPGGSASHPGFYYKTVTERCVVHKSHAWYIKHGISHNAFGAHEKCPHRPVWGHFSIYLPAGETALSRRGRRPTARSRGWPRRSRRRRSAAPWWPGRRARHRPCRHRWPRSSCRTAGRRSSRCRC